MSVNWEIPSDLKEMHIERLASFRENMQETIDKELKKQFQKFIDEEHQAFKTMQNSILNYINM